MCTAVAYYAYIISSHINDTLADVPAHINMH